MIRLIEWLRRYPALAFMKKYIKEYWKPFCAAVFFLTIEAICDLLQPTIMASVIDIGVANRDMDYVLRMGGVMLLITAVGAIGASSRNILATIVSQRFGAELRSDLYKKTQTLSLENLDHFDRASLITRLTNDVTQVQIFTNGLMRIFVKAPLLCIGSIIMAIRLNQHLAVVLAVTVPIVSILIFMNMKVGFPFFLKVQKALDRVNGVMREYLLGVRVVKAFNRFDYEIEKFSGVNEDLQRKSTNANRVMSAFRPGIMLTMNFGIVAVLWLGGLGVQHGNIQVGHIIAFINYMTQILFSLMMIFMVFNMFVRAKASAGRIGEVFKEESHQTWNTEAAFDDDLRGKIEFQHVSFTYKGTSESVLKNISFTCLPGETVGIIGSTGSGKTSLINLIPRFYDVTEGSILVDGVDIKTIDPKRLREKIAVVPQKTVLFSGTVIENMKWGKEDSTEAEIEKALKMAEAYEFILSTPEGLKTRIGQDGVNFSGGQKQRVSIARALIRNPEILILDDSTSAVDTETEVKIKASLKKYARHLTCLLIAQRITSVMDADKIIVLEDGEIAGVGSHQELIETCRVYQEIFTSQVGKEAN